MKKYWKQITLGLTVVLLAVAGYLVYAFEFKEYETADKEVDKVTEEKIEVDLPDDSKIVVDEEGNVTEEKDEDKEEDKEADTTEDAAASTDASATASNNTSGTVQTAAVSTNSSQTAGASANGNSSNGKSDANNGKAGNGNNGSNNGNKGNNGSNKGTERVTVSQIKARYETSLTRLEDTANARIDGLVNVAKKEYQADPSPNYAYYYNKYTGAASKLEGQMDAAFYGVIGVMKRDLKANGLAESHVKSVINEYENTKKQRRNALMKKAAGLK